MSTLSPPRRRRASATIAGLAAALPLGIFAVTGFGPGAAIGAPPAHNPPGNNGTVKINDITIDSNPRNEPHVTCQFAVRFFGFDANQVADIVFFGHPPSGHGQLLLEQDNRVISTTPAGGAGNDTDKVFYYSASDLNLSGLTLQPQQGYHIKLEVNIHNVPGGDKYKVFWLKPCATTSPTPTPTATAISTGTASPAPTTSPSGTASPTSTPSGPTSPAPTGSATATPAATVTASTTSSPTPTVAPTKSVTPTATVAATETAKPKPTGTPSVAPIMLTSSPTPTTAVLGEIFSRTPSAAPGAQVLGEKQSRVLGTKFTRGLPFTGANGIVSELVVGLIALVTGVGLYAAGRWPGASYHGGHRARRIES